MAHTPEECRTLSLSSCLRSDMPVGEPEVYTDLGYIDEREPNNPDLSAQELPRLHRLPLDSSSHLLRDPLLYASLNNLVIRNCGYDGSLDDFVTMVAHGTRLRKLSLVNFLENFVPKFTGQTKRLNLAGLTLLSLSERSATHIAAFLNRVQLSLGVQLSSWIHVPRNSVPVGGLAVLLPPNPTLALPILWLVSEATLTVDASELSYNFTLREGQEEASSGGSVNFGISFESPEQWADPRTLTSIPDLVRSISVPLKFLLVSSAHAGPLTNDYGWEALFCGLPHLDQLIVKGHGIDCALFMGLTYASNATPPACPELISLECNRIMGRPELFFMILTCMVTRHHRGLPLLSELALTVHYKREQEHDRQRILNDYLPTIRDLVCRIDYSDVINDDDY